MSEPFSQAASTQEGAAIAAGLSTEAPALYLLDDPAQWDSFGTPDASAQGAAAASVWTSHVALQGMYCATCALKIEEALRSVPGVLQVHVSAAAQRASVVWDAQQVLPSQWMAAVVHAGYRAFPARDAHARAQRKAHNRKALWRWLLAAFCMMQVMMYAWPAYDAQPGDLSLEYEQLLRWASWVICIPMLIFSCGPFFSAAWHDLQRRRISMDLPVALGMAMTFVVSTLGTFNPQGIFGREVFYDSLTMFVCFLLAGRWLEMRLRERTAGALDAVLHRLPDSVQRLQPDGSFVRIALRHIAVGDVLRILPGEAFPADGVIVQGRTHTDEALLTGESRAQARDEGSRVIAGSYNLSAPVQVRVQVRGADTKFAQIVALMESAATQKPRLAALADKVAGPFLLVVTMLAVAAAVYWWPADPGHALMVAAAVLIVTCPCALSLATPVAMLTAAGTLARHGVLVRNLQGLEVLARITDVVFDKTGTLTRDGLQVRAVHMKDADAAQRLRGLAAAVAQHSRHPVARAVWANGQTWHTLWKVCELQEISGHGLRAQVQLVGQAHSMWVRLGSRTFTQQYQADAGMQAVFLVQEVDGAPWQALACLELDEGLRGEAAGVVAALHSMQLRVHLLSGDASSAVERVAQDLKIENYQAQCAPATKLQVVRQAQAAGQCVAMVGDGLNDGPVLAGADVSFAFGQAVPVAQSRADFVVLSDDLALVQQAIGLARKTMRIVRQNLIGAALYNAVCIPLAIAGWMPAWLAGLGMALSSLLVVLNAARLSQTLQRNGLNKGADAACVGGGMQAAIAH